jgi:hypothetical protein
MSPTPRRIDRVVFAVHENFWNASFQHHENGRYGRKSGGGPRRTD